MMLFYLDAFFSLWMLVDAARRGASYYWYPIILLPFGEWAYFFMVKVHDPTFEPIRRTLTRLTTKSVTVEQLRLRLRQAPSFANRLMLAQALHDQGDHTGAVEHFEMALQLDATSLDARYGLASSQLGVGSIEEGVGNFRRVIDREPSFREYAACTELAQALIERGETELALAELEQLVAKSPRLNHRVLYAHYLAHDGQREQACEQLRVGLDEHGLAPRYNQRQNRAWARRAKSTLQQLDG